MALRTRVPAHRCSFSGTDTFPHSGTNGFVSSWGANLSGTPSEAHL